MDNTLPTASQVFELPADLGVANAATLQDELLKLNASPTDIELNGGNVERVHTASLQLLTALFRDMKQTGRVCTWSAVSTALRQAVDTLGLTEILHMPEVTAGNAEIEKETV